MRQFIVGVVVFGAAAGMLGCASSNGGAGSSDDAENVGVVEDALVAGGCPGGYPFQTTTLPFGTLTSRCQDTGDYDNSASVPANLRFYFTGFAGSTYFGAECGGPPDNHHYIVGVSSRTDVFRAHAAKCSTRSHGVFVPAGNGSGRHYLSRTNAQGFLINDPVNSQVGGWDWDPGNIKAECGFHEVVTGLGQTESNEIDAISCSTGNVMRGATSNTCEVLKFSVGDHCPEGCSGNADWDRNNFKNTCRASQYIKGVSKRVQGGLGEISAILCCSWG